MKIEQEELFGVVHGLMVRWHRRVLRVGKYTIPLGMWHVEAAF